MNRILWNEPERLPERDVKHGMFTTYVKYMSHHLVGYNLCEGFDVDGRQCECFVAECIAFVKYSGCCFGGKYRMVPKRTFRDVQVWFDSTSNATLAQGVRNDCDDERRVEIPDHVYNIPYRTKFRRTKFLGRQKCRKFPSKYNVCQNIRIRNPWNSFRRTKLPKFWEGVENFVRWKSSPPKLCPIRLPSSSSLIWPDDTDIVHPSAKRRNCFISIINFFFWPDGMVEFRFI